MKRWLVRLMVVLTGGVLLSGGLIELSGQHYLFTAVRDTYLRGRITPPIGESASVLTRYVREIAAREPQRWPLAPDYRRGALPQDVDQKMTAYRTKAFLVIENGAIRREVYWAGFDASSRSNSNSVAKSLVGALTGIALSEGRLRSLDQPVGDFLPEFATPPRSAVTIRHLLTMSATSGFSENYDNPFALPARLHYGSDLTDLLLRDFRLVAKPGSIFKYDSGNTALLGLALTRAAGMTLSEYASTRLWQALGAERGALWSLDHEGGMERAYCCIYATARDFARLGQLYLDGGRWQGRALLPASFVAESFQAAPLRNAQGRPSQRYGYSWWRMQHRGYAVFYAWGYQGQYIAVIPQRHLVMVRLGDGGGYTQDHDRQDLPLYLDAALDAV